MNKILFIPFAASLGHISRCLAIADALRADNDCLFAIGEEGKELVEKAGYKTKSVPEVSSRTFKSDSPWKWLSKEYYKRNLDAEIAIIEEFYPDVIIFDFRFTSAISAKIKGIPSIGIVHGSVLHIIQNTRESAVDLLEISGYNYSKSIRNAFFAFIFPLVYRRFLAQPINRINPILKQHKIKKIKILFDLLLGDSTFVADIPELIPSSVKLSGSLQVVGPLMWSGWNNIDGNYFKQLDKNPFIYLTMGSTIDAQLTIYKLIEALKDLPYHVVISKGSLWLDLKDIPENIHIYSYVPGNFIASKSSLVIYHGGHETLMQALYSGVPSLVIPINPDQLIIAKQIKKTGIGDFLRNANEFLNTKEPLKNVSVETIRNLIINLLNDKECKNRCQNLKKIMGTYIDLKGYLNYIVLVLMRTNNS